MTRLQRQNALADALLHLGLSAEPTSRPLRLPDFPEPARSWVMTTYRRLGGVLDAPKLQPLGWDIPTMGGLIVELDEEQHFNRYRAETLSMNWAGDLPWREDYLTYCAEFERVALRSHSSGGFWESDGSVAQFGAAGPRRSFEQGGSPRWKQRAVYDAMRDAAARAGLVSLARLSVYDRVGEVRLGDALRGHSVLDLHSLRALVERRTISSEAHAPSGRPLEAATQPVVSVRSTHTVRDAPTASEVSTYVPKELARMLGHHNESRPGLVVRTYLRKRYPDHPKNAPWVLNQAQAYDVLANVPPKTRPNLS